MKLRTGWRGALAIVGGGGAIFVLASCGFTARNALPQPPCEDSKLTLREAIGGPPVTVFEEPGSIVVMHGSARSACPDGGDLWIEQSASLPSYANRATVFLNGWQASYNGSDHHLGQVAAMLARIRVTPGKITWVAGGTLRDDGEEETFQWSYRYTIIAWNDSSVRAMVDHNDAEYYCKANGPHGSDNFFYAENDPTTTALTTFASFLENGGFASGRQVAVLPRGFGVGWGTDHHLLQMGYNLESVAPFVRHQDYRKAFSTVKLLTNPGEARVGGEFVSWKTSVILKDDSARRDYGFVEVVSAMGGPDVEIIQPEFSLLPIEDADGGLGGAGLKSAEVVIGNLPYACAVPMLTGWNIGYTVSDQHVKELGIWLDELRYDRLPGSPTGTLRYKVYSIVKDDDDYPDNFFQHKVTVLGLKPTGVVVRPQQ